MDKKADIQHGNNEVKVGGITGKGFVKGDPRINRKGRPKSFDKLRELAQQISHEEAASPDGKEYKWQGKPITFAEYILRTWALSKNPSLQMKFVEVAFGKVPDEIKMEVTDRTKELIKAIREADGAE